MSDASRAGRPMPVPPRPEDHHGGVKIGSAFCGWLTATGTAVLISALLSVIGATLGPAIITHDAGPAASEAAPNPQTPQAAGLISALMLLMILFVAYYCGGYVASRMTRSNEIKQGIAVWIWGLVIALVLTLLGTLLGTQLAPLATLTGIPYMPITANTLTTLSILTALTAAAASLLGAILGGLAGRRFHRNIN